MNSVLTKRATVQYELPISEDIALLRPELAVLKFGNSKTVDVGLLCYSQRHFPDKETRSTGRRVALASLNFGRFNHVRSLIYHISACFKLGSRRTETLYSHFTRLIAFVNWADKNNFADVLADGENARAAFTEYVHYIRDRVGRNEISLNAGAAQLHKVAEALGNFFDIEAFDRGFNLLRKDANTANVTSPPPETSQGQVLAICKCLFEGLSEFVLEKHKFPHQLAMPKYLNFPNDSLWIFPGTSWFKTPSMLEASETNAGYNFSSGRLSTAEELQIEYPVGKSKHRWTDVRRDSRLQVETANSDFNHTSRWHLGNHAIHSYCILFLAATGMNWAQLAQLTWDDDTYDVEASRQGYRTIKWRAGGKPVSFELPISGLPAFKRFLELRRYVLQGRPCEFLFFRSRTQLLPTRPYVNGLNIVYLLLRRIDPQLPMISPRAWRAAKSDWLVRNTDPSTAALVLQNTEKTVLQSYAAGSETTHFEEMGNFLSQMASTVISREEVVEEGTPRSVGTCSSFGAPELITSDTPLAPDCRASEGCLFCDKLRVHADEIDTRKLLSCRYCIKLATPNESSMEFFHNAVQPVLDRITHILEEIAERSPEMVQRITQEVEEDGVLDPYWESKAHMLMNLGW